MKPRLLPSRRKVLLVAALLVGGVALAAWVLQSSSRGDVDPIAVTGLLVTAVALALQVASFVKESPADPARSLGVEAEDLAAVLRTEWQGEVDVRRLQSPRVLPLEWRESGRPVADSPQAVAGSPAAGVTVALKLGGRLDTNYEQATRKLAESYLGIRSKRLLILGEPGSGKSVLALLLGLGLLETRTAERPVPVLLPLASWDPLNQDLDAWIVQYLAVSYYHGDPTIPGMLLGAGRILPILDGLDEIPETLRRTATREINRALSSDRGVVVTCRSVEYEDLIEGGAPTLRRAPVVEVCAIPPMDAIEYLRSIDWPDDVVWDAAYTALERLSGGPLAHALSTPLMIGFARLVYERLHLCPEDLVDETQFDSRHKVEEHLTTKVVDAAYAPPRTGPDKGRPPSRWKADDARRWLTFLARDMQRNRERELRWWLLAPRLLPWWVGPAVGIAVGVLVLILAVVYAIAGTPDGTDDGFTTAIATAFACGGGTAVLVMVVWFATPGRAPGRLSLTRHGSWARLARGLPTGVIVLLTVGVPVLVVVAFTVLATDSWRVATVELLYQTTAVFVFLTAVAGLTTAADAWSSSPSTGAGRATPRLTLDHDRGLALLGSAVPALVAGLLLLPACAGGIGLGSVLVRGSTGWSGWPGRPEVGAVVASALGDLTGLFRFAPALAVGIWIVVPVVTVYVLFALSRAWPRFAIFRVVMAIRRTLPRDLPGFLDDARNNNLLRRAAGAYQFTHVRLQESLANAPAVPRNGAPARSVRHPRIAVAVAILIVAVGIPVATLPRNNATFTLSGGSTYAATSVVSGDGRYLAVADDRMVTVWSIATGVPAAELGEQTDVVSDLEFSPDARLLVVRTGAVERTSTGSELAAAQQRYRFTVWDVLGRRALARDVAQVVVLARGRAMLTAAPRSAGSDQVDLWNTESGERVRALAGVESIDQVTLPASGKIDEVIDPAPSEDAARLLALDDDRRPALVAAGDGTLVPLRPLDGTIGPAVFDTTGTLVLAPLSTGMRIWRARDGGLVGDTEAITAARVVAVPSAHRMVVTSGRPRSAAADSAVVVVYDTESGARIGSGIEDAGGFAPPSTEPEGNVVALPVPERTETELLDVRTGDRIATLPALAAFARRTAYADDTRASYPLLQEAAGNRAGALDVRLWAPDGTARATLRSSLDPDASSSSGGSVFEASLAADDSRVAHSLNATVAPDGRTAAATEPLGPDGATTLRLYDLGSGRVIQTISGEIGASRQSGFSLDGALFAAALARRVQLWDVRAGRGCSIALRSAPFIVRFGPAGTTLTTVDGGAEEAHVWDTRTCRELGALRGHSGPIRGVEYGDDDRTIRTAGDDNTLRVYELPR